ncbi:autotransporter outer membrane beta-barrel domain-containing protein [Lysobacter sp. LF1]|uniref:Autotransporter outer membrane beta-barrel domain-containing protein n=1 Tax=Lysobacter stagni TaxID=3045172 RepID=A0ABT6XCS2_9GAMM|nr:autotransporter outer membrane beta-barrel domain-containing protein [Lysobacter sp. LF1]MDI9237942.1 autotransporter outer membrane beta-barrel domain-containing protein [Lysobacter sp. LF1]
MHRARSAHAALRSRRSRLYLVLRSALLLAAHGSIPICAYAQDFGPGTISPLLISSGTPRLVGNTTITATGGTHTVEVTGGTLTVDTQAVSPGAIVLQPFNGNGLFANGGTILVLNGVNVFPSNGGHAVVANGSASSITLNAGQLGTAGVGSGLVAIGGARISATSTTINNVATAGTTISAGHGAIAESGGQITLGAGNSISTAAINSVALGASGANSLVQLTSPTVLPITLNGRSAMGIYMHDGGLVQTVANTQFLMNGTNSVGVSVDNTNVPAGTLGSGLTVTFATAPISEQAGGTGLAAFNNGAISLDTFKVAGPGAAIGVWARAGSTVTLTGASSIDIQSAFNGSYYTLTSANLATVNGPVGSTFSVTGATPNAGLRTDGGRIVSTGTIINVSSANSYGAWTSINTGGPGTIDLTNNTITTTGANDSALFAGSNGTITGRDSRLTTNNGAAAMQVYTFTGPGSIDLTNTVVTATGADTVGLYSANFMSSGINRVDLSGGSLTSDDVAMLGTGPSNVFVDSGATVTSPTWMMYAYTSASFGPTQPTVLQVFADDATLEGAAGADTRSIGNLELANGSHWTGEAYYLTNAGIDATSVWTVPLDSLLTSQLRNAGRIEFTAPQGGVFKDVWTREYVASGGTLAVNTYLGTDGSPSDRLVLYNGGSATGQGLLEVANAGGPGDVTSGNGILVVQAIEGATTAVGLLALSRRVIAGPYEYTLERGSVDADSPHNWYLRSSLDCSGPNAPVPPCPGPNPPDPPPDPDPDPPDPPPSPPDPPPDPPPIPDPPAPPPEPPVPPLPPFPPPIPAYRAEVSLYGALAPTALQYGKSLLDTLHERVGEQEQLRGRADLDEADRIDGFWGRLMYVDGEKDAERGGVYGRGPQYDYQFAAVQLGVDLRRHLDDDGNRTHTGIYGAIGVAETQVQHIFANLAGDIHIDGYTLGGYWTRYTEREAYIDTVLQATWYDAQAVSASHDVKLSTEGWGLAASVEGGYPFRLRHDWIIEPQAQLIYGWLDLEDASDVAAEVRFEDTESLIGRLSARLHRTWSNDDDPVRVLDRTGWLRLSAWYDFKGDATTEFSARRGFVPFHSDMGGGWWELEAGFTGDMDRNRFIYANVGYQLGFDDDRRSWEAKLGFRANW